MKKFSDIAEATNKLNTLLCNPRPEAKGWGISLVFAASQFRDAAEKLDPRPFPIASETKIYELKPVVGKLQTLFDEKHLRTRGQQENALDGIAAVVETLNAKHLALI